MIVKLGCGGPVLRDRPLPRELIMVNVFDPFLPLEMHCLSITCRPSISLERIRYDAIVQLSNL